MFQRRDEVEDIAARSIHDIQKHLDVSDRVKIKTSGRSAEQHLLYLWNHYTVGKSSRNSFSDLENGGAVSANISIENYRGQRTVVLNIELLKNKDGQERLCELAGNTSRNVGIGASLSQPPQYD
jgi:hypothetical protein